MNRLHLILVSLRYYARMNLAVALGVAAATAVLTGALLVGDSMRASLRRLALDRLGRVDEVLASDHFFRAELAEELAAQEAFRRRGAKLVPAIGMEVSLRRPEEGVEKEENRLKPALQLNQVTLYAVPAEFWKLGKGGPAKPPGRREIALSSPAAERLDVQVGDTILLQYAPPRMIPAETALGEKRDTVERVRVRVASILAEGLGRFGTRPTQQLPRNAYVDLAWFQRELDRPGAANTILLAGPRVDPPLAPTPPDAWRVGLADCGLRLIPSVGGVWTIDSDRMLLSPAEESALRPSLHGLRVEPVLTYLADTMAVGEKAIAYCTVTAIDFPTAPPGAVFRDAAGRPIGPLGDEEIVLNAWAAEDLKARVGDSVTLSFFQPASSHGQFVLDEATFRLAAVVPLEGPAADPTLTPPVPGITDQLTMADWDPPFPFQAGRVSDRDEAYWKQHRATPKAFVSTRVGQKLWASRFGRATALRVLPDQQASSAALDETTLRARLTFPPAAMGMAFRPVKAEALAAAVGSTPFNVLFLAFSFFLIVAAAMLVALLFRLGVEQRAPSIGILLAAGFPRGQVRHLLAGEGALVAAVGSAIGVLGGLGYAAAMLWGLRTWWLDAVGTPFLHLAVTPGSLAGGYLAGVLVAVLSIQGSVRRMARFPAARLLAGATGTAAAIPSVTRRTLRRMTVLQAGAGGILAALAVLVFLLPLGEPARAGAFFGVGAATLAVGLLSVWHRLRTGTMAPAVAEGGGNLLRLSIRNAERNPGRSALGMGLIASASFLIVAVSAFRADPAGRKPSHGDGTGGYMWVAQSVQPLFHDLGTREGRRELGVAPGEESRLAGLEAFGFRVVRGDDASCLNLYQVRQPTVLGAPDAFLRRGGFAWAGSAARTPGEQANPWRLLHDPPSDLPAGTVPVVLDEATSTYALHLSGVGADYTISDGNGRPVRLRVVGLLRGSVLQGMLVLREADVLRLYPDVSGYRFFLIADAPGQAADAQAALESALGNYGLAVETTGRRLAEFLVVQNTYLTTFQTLGGLGLLLGTVGLAAVQLRNVLERRGELALLRAVGFRPSRLVALVVLENALVLLAGLGLGTLAASLAALPHALSGSALIPWLSLGKTLLAVLAVGLLASLAAVRAVLAAPLPDALRGE